MSLRKTRRKEDEESLAREDSEPLIEKIYKRIKAPIVWDTLDPCYLIQDLHPNYYDEAIELIKSSYMARETMCRSIEILDDEESVEGYEKYIRIYLKDECSIMCLCSETNELVGLLLMRVIHQEDYGKVFSRIKITSGEKFQRILDLQRHIHRKTPIFEMYECDKVLRIYLMDISPDHKGQDIDLALMKSATKVARALGVPILMGIFTSHFTQTGAKMVGMEIINEIYYVDWLDENKNMIFDDPGVGNYTCAVMAGRIPPPRFSQISI